MDREDVPIRFCSFNVVFQIPNYFTNLFDRNRVSNFVNSSFIHKFEID